MKHITKREFEVITLYSRGLSFKEIGLSLSIATRTAINYYMRAKNKSKTHITNAQRSRDRSKIIYKLKLKEVVNMVKKLNSEVREFTIYKKQISVKEQTELFRLNYINDCLIYVSKTYHKNRLKKAKELQ